MTNALRTANIKNIEITDPIFGYYVSIISESILPLPMERFERWRRYH